MLRTFHGGKLGLAALCLELSDNSSWEQTEMTPLRTATLLAVGAVLSLQFTAAAAQNSTTSTWSITPYFWASDTSLDLTVEDTDINGGVEIPFSDLLDVLDTAFQIHIEAGKGKVSGFADITFLETSDTIERPLVEIATNSKQTFIDAALAYWPGGVGSQFNFYGGLRYTAFDDRYDIMLGADPLVTRRSSQDYYDALLGVRYRFELSTRWGLLTRADLSLGDTEGTWLVQGLFAYTVGKRQQNRILFGYQYKAAEFKDGGLTSDYTFDGPIAGFNFRF
jgi:hypothetical protein